VNRVVEERLVKFSLFGQDFSFYTDAPEEEVEGAVALLRQEFESDAALFGKSTVPSSKMLVLGCLRIAARYVELEQRFRRFRQGQEEDIDRLVRKVSANLDESG